MLYCFFRAYNIKFIIIVFPQHFVNGQVIVTKVWPWKWWYILWCSVHHESHYHYGGLSVIFGYWLSPLLNSDFVLNDQLNLVSNRLYDTTLKLFSNHSSKLNSNGCVPNITCTSSMQESAFCFLPMKYL